MKNVKLIMTVEQMKDRDAWLRLRTLGIGGSDAGIIAGLNRWKSPFQLWLEKKEKKLHMVKWITLENLKTFLDKLREAPDNIKKWVRKTLLFIDLNI